MIATDKVLEDCPLPQVDLNNPEEIVDAILAQWGGVMTIAFPQDISLDEAITLLRDQLSVQSASEIIGLDKAMGRITSDDIIADINVPQNDTAAVDGYAAFFEDLKGRPLKVTGNIKAGHPFDGKVQKGVAYRIFYRRPCPNLQMGWGQTRLRCKSIARLIQRAK